MDMITFEICNPKTIRLMEQMGKIEALVASAIRVIMAREQDTDTEHGLRRYCHHIRAQALGLCAHPSVPYWVFGAIVSQLPERRCSPVVGSLVNMALRDLRRLIKNNCGRIKLDHFHAIVGQFKCHIMAPRDHPYRFDFGRLRYSWHQIGFTAVARFVDYIALDLNIFRCFYNEFPQIRAQLPDTCELLSFVVDKEGQRRHKAALAVFAAAAASRSYKSSLSH